MLTIGVDAHRQVHQALALDDTGTVLGSWRGANTPDQWQQLLAWAAIFPGPRQWGIEGAWNYGRGLAQFLVAHDEIVFEVNPRWTAGGRRRARKAGRVIGWMRMLSLSWCATRVRACPPSPLRMRPPCSTCW